MTAVVRTMSTPSRKCCPTTSELRRVKIGCLYGPSCSATSARALTDKEEREGIQAANAMGAHSTESQTADYVRRKSARKTNPTA